MEDMIEELKQYDLNLISKANIIENKFYIKYRKSNAINLCLIMLCDDNEHNNLLDNIKFCNISYYAFNENIKIDKMMLEIYLNFCKNYSKNDLVKYSNYYFVYRKSFNSNVKISFIYQTTFEHYKKKYTKFFDLNDFINYWIKNKTNWKTINIYYKMCSDEIYFNM